MKQNGKYENLNSMKSQLQYYHTKHCGCSYLINCTVFVWILQSNRFTLVNLTTSSKFETRKLYTIISQLHHMITTKQLASANW